MVLGLNVFIGVPSLFIIDIFRTTTPKNTSYTSTPNTTGLYKKGAMLCIRIHLQLLNINETLCGIYCFL